jgi:hypothetical protein
MWDDAIGAKDTQEYEGASNPFAERTRMDWELSSNGGQPSFVGFQSQAWVVQGEDAFGDCREPSEFLARHVSPNLLPCIAHRSKAVYGSCRMQRRIRTLAPGGC